MKKIRPFGPDDGDGEVADPMTRRLIADLPEMVAGGETHVDVESIMRLGSCTLRRRRNLTAAGVAAGVVALVIGGTIIGRPPPSGVQTAGSGAVPVCPSTRTLALVHWVAGGETGSMMDEGSPVPDAASTAQESVAVTAPSFGWSSVLPESPTWFTTAKGLQLTDALRASFPAEVKVLKGNDDWLRFDGGLQLGAGTTVAISAGGSADVQISPAVPLMGNGDSSTQVPMVVADATVFKTDKGWGTLSVAVGAVAQTPTCSNGPIARRLSEKDGTAVDIGSISTTAPGSGSIQHSLSVTAYRPDGTVVMASTSTSGRADELPMTAQELTAVATAPGLGVHAPVSPAQSSLAARITTGENGIVSTAPPKTSVTRSPTRR